MAGDVDVGGAVTQLETEYDRTCALLTTGKLRCWGFNLLGQLGYGHQNTIGDDELPSSAGDVPVGGNVLQVAAGLRHTCALLDTGRVRCSGHNESGQLGYGHKDNVGDDELPSSAGDVNVGRRVVQLAAGFAFTCALLDTGRDRCWGDNEFGQLGYGHTNAIGDTELPSSAGDVNVGRRGEDCGRLLVRVCGVGYRSRALLGR